MAHHDYMVPHRLVKAHIEEMHRQAREDRLRRQARPARRVRPSRPRKPMLDRLGGRMETLGLRLLEPYRPS